VVCARQTVVRNRKELSVSFTVTFRGPTTTSLRRGLCAVFAASAVGGVGVAALMGPSATAATDPCAASEVARTVGTVANSTGNYLDTHPETNQALTTISQQQAGPQSLGTLKTYFDANPQAGKDLQALQQPLMNLSGRCKLPITIPQLLGLMQAAQQQGGGLPSALPGTLQTAQTLGTPGAALPAQSAPASSVSQGRGPLPGPAGVPAR
jgi:heme-binding protein